MHIYFFNEIGINDDKIKALKILKIISNKSTRLNNIAFII